LEFKKDIERDTHLKEYAEKKMYWRKRNWYYHESIANQLKFFIPEGSSVIEIGCGEGGTLNKLAPNTSVGIDKNKYILEKGREKYPGITFLLSDIEDESPLDDLISEKKKFDYIIISDLIGTLDDIQSVFEKMRTTSGILYSKSGSF
jgi:SAM-dependent methyltransferase